MSATHVFSVMHFVVVNKIKGEASLWSAGRR
jgi:hypothetical protein